MSTSESLAAEARPRRYALLATGLTLGVAETGLTFAAAYGRFLRQSERVVFTIAALATWLGATLLSTFAFRALERLRPERRFRVGAAIAAVLVVPPAWMTFGGRQVHDYQVVLTLAAALVAAFVGHRVLRWIDRAPESRAYARLLLLASIACLVVDRYVLVRLYPAFHHALVACAVLGAGASVSLTPSGRWRRLNTAAVLTVALAALLVGSLQMLAGDPSARLVAEEHSSLTGRMLRLWPDDDAVPEGGEDIAPSYEPEGEGPDLSGRSVLLLTVDALRADALSAALTPELMRIAEASVVFERAYTPTPHTSYALTSMLTGKYMRPVLQLAGARRDHSTLPAILREYGYRTAAFYPPAVFYVDASRFASLSHTGFDFEYRKTMFAPAAARAPQLDTYFEEAAGEGPVFAWVHLFEPHEPYDPPPEFRRGDSPRERYDGEVRAADAAIGDIVRVFRERRPNGVVVISADHGEEFGEHGGHHHGTTLYDEQLAVPLVVSVPELEPRRVSAPVELVDIATTVLAGLAIPRDVRMRGDDLGPVLLGGAGPPFAFADVGDARMVTDGRHKAICEDGRCRLFDLQRDPAEQRNVAAQEPQVLARLRSALAAFVRSLPEVEAMEVGGGVGWPAALAAAELGEGRGDDLLPFLSADAPALRAASARLLCETEYTRARPLLVRLAASDSDEFVRREAMLCAAMLGDEASHAAVRERLGAIDPERVGADSLQDFCRRAALHLAHEGAEAVRWLVAIVGDAEASLDARLRAVEGLALAHEGSERERALDGLIEA
ncbi:MAG: sulfatase-like hydrolase/transferase, partial [Myxococcota bacterium]